MLPPIFSGVQVLDFSRLLPGPFASQLLVEMGAKVDCIVAPSPDPILGAYSPFDALRAGKTFHTLDLKNPIEKKQVEEKIRHSGIFLESFRPGAMERLGLGYTEVARLRPGILYVSILGYGPQHKRYRDGAHDINFLVDSGLYSLIFTDAATDIPVIQLADVMGGFYACLQILAAWFEVLKTGQGKHLQVSIVEGLERMGRYLQDPNVEKFLPMVSGSLARYHIYKTRDGKRLALGAVEQKFFDRILQVLQLEQTLAQSEDLLMKNIAAKIALHTMKELQELFHGVDACISAVPARAEVLF